MLFNFHSCFISLFLVIWVYLLFLEDMTGYRCERKGFLWPLTSWLTFPFSSFPPKFLGIQNEAPEAQCDLPSCFYPFLTHQGKNSSQMLRESSEPARTPAVPPSCPTSLVRVGGEIKTPISEEPCPACQGEVKQTEIKNRGRQALLVVFAHWYFLYLCFNLIFKFNLFVPLNFESKGECSACPVLSAVEKKWN